MITIQFENGTSVTVNQREVRSENQLLQEGCSDIAEHLPLLDSPCIPDVDRYIPNAIVEALGGKITFDDYKPEESRPGDVY